MTGPASGVLVGVGGVRHPERLSPAAPAGGSKWGVERILFPLLLRELLGKPYLIPNEPVPLGSVRRFGFHRRGRFSFWRKNIPHAQVLPDLGPGRDSFARISRCSSVRIVPVVGWD